MKKFKSGFTLAEVLITLSVIGIIAAIVLPSVIAGYQYKTIGVKLSKFAASLEQAARAYAVGDPFVLNNETRLNAQLNHFVNDALVIKFVSGNKADCSKLSGAQKTSCENANKILSSGDNADGALQGNVIALSPYQQVTSLSYKPIYKNAGTSQSGMNETETYMSAIMKDDTAVTIAAISDTDRETIVKDYTSMKSGSSTVATDPRVKNLIDEYKFGLPVAQVRFDPNVTGLPNDAHQSYYFYITQNGYVVPAVEDTCLIGIYLNEWKGSADMFAPSGACGSDGKLAKGE